MEKVIRGKASIFEKNIDTDQLYPGRYLELTDPQEIGKHVMEGGDSGRFFRADLLSQCH